MREAERAADRLYLVAHDPASGRPHLGPRQLGVGLAAALLGELLDGGLVELRAGEVHATGQQPFLRRIRHHSSGLTIMGWCAQSHRPVDQAKASESCPWCGVVGVEMFPDRMLWDEHQLIARETTPRPVADWLTVLAADAPGLVAYRLAADGWLLAEDRRRVWSGRIARSWVPTNVVEAHGAREALRRIALGLNRPTAADRLVAALVTTVDLTRVVTTDVPDPTAAARALAHVAADLPESMRLLVEQSRAAADNAVMNHTG
jgi:Golgi phosphoprotein 3 GPP34